MDVPATRVLDLVLESIRSSEVGKDLEAVGNRLRGCRIRV